MKFDLYDNDSDGHITFDELYLMLLDTLTQLLKDMNHTDIISEKGNTKIIASIVSSVAKDIMTKLDKDKNDNLDWVEFKKYIKSEEYAK